NSQTRQTNEKDYPPKHKQHTKTKKHIASKCSTWNNGEHQKLSTEKKICREILIVCRQILIVGEDQRARYLLLMKRMKRKGCKNETTKIK
ncbi:hypothetical protein, partial [Thiolapillus sp.]|uniref:hypothetical protein n=1 Tax=Thiolapillus sp. TaxID=2017437 RepID=UPI003AF725CC